ncbi:hypothetical protein ACDP63_16930 [Paracoccus sp. P2]|uniref:hypothetical protein n=1 Tax=Paracoccus sp. P2 TaxID=3248840 RepID=UPI00391F2BCA
MASIICYRSGETEVVGIVPEGALVLATGKRELLETVLSGVARHAHDGETLLVPGLPEAADNDQAVAAATSFRLMIERSLKTLRSAPDLH